MLRSPHERFVTRKPALPCCDVTRGNGIVLIGFMGAGKSAAGRALAVRKALPLYDTDRMVAARFGLDINTIFARFGEESFRDAESEALDAIPMREVVVVTGGGLVLRPENVQKLRRLGTIVHLVADEATLFKRVSRRETRPLLQTANPRDTLATLLQIRTPLYEKAADVAVNTSDLSHEAAVEAILRQLSQHAHAC
jgi:shikimate kinase